MKKMLTRRVLSLLMALCLVLSLVPTALAAEENSSDIRLPFTVVSDDDSALARETTDNTASSQYGANESVRVSIVLEEPSVIEKGYATQNLAENRSAMAYRAQLQSRQQSVIQSISRALPQKLDVVWNLTLAANVISANVPYGQIDTIRALSGVKSVTLETRYDPAVYETESADPNMATSGAMIGSSAAYAAGYNGAGMRIAVIDTGTDTDHQSFDAAAFDYAIAQDGGNYDLLDADEIAGVLTQLNAYKRTLKDGKATAATPAAEDLYVSGKLPFGYNYVDGSLDITHDGDTQGEHGSHVAGIAAANRYIPEGDGFVSALDAVKVQGVAPDAQLITMKVFGSNGGAYDSDYMAAIEDAILLGCDAVNLSLGSSSAGFTSSGVYDQFLSEVMDTDLVLTVSAGNAGSWADNTWNGHLYSDSVNLDTVGAPGSYPASLTVASADNVGYTGQYFTVGDRQIFYTETSNTGGEFASLAGRELEYVLIDGYGDYGDWDNADLTGKVAVCSRGETNFSAKAQNAFDAGAIAVLVYNNQPGAINMDLSDYTGTAPCVSIPQADGAWMKAQAQEADGYYIGKLTVAESVSSTVNSDPVSMSSFSSWGVPGSLELKPEITAPGGNIYSVNGAIPGGKSYENMSGTSMAAPQMAGMTALLVQYLEDAGLPEKTGLSARQLAQSLLMSTAQPLTDAASGSFYPVIQQGAGLANVGDAIAATSYVMVDGQPDGKVKAELGDDPDRSGVYTFSFTLNNLTDAAQGYQLSADLFTQNVFEDFATSDGEWRKENGYDYNMAMYLDKTTRALNAEVEWTVNGKTVEPDDSLTLLDFDGDGDVDLADGQALLDYACGNRENLSALDRADLDGNGSVTTYDAYLFLQELNRGAVELAAKGSAEITVTVRLSDSEKQQLTADFENGAYIQGYFTATSSTTAEGVRGVAHSIPMLAFYGNWTDASMYENGDWGSYDAGLITKSPYMGYVTVNYLGGTSLGSGSVYRWGTNPISSSADEEYLPQRASLNNQNGDEIAQYYVSPIRNAANARVQVVNAETGEVYKEREVGQLSAAFYYAGTQQWMQMLDSLNVAWDGSDANGDPLPEGTQAEVRVTLAPEYYVDAKTGKTDWDALGDGATLTFPSLIDNTAPEILSVTVDKDTRTVTVRARDNGYLAGCGFLNPNNGSYWGQRYADQKEPGQVVEFTFSAQRFSGRTLKVALYDYAANQTTYLVDMTEALGNQEPSYEFGAFWSGEWLLFDRDYDDTDEAGEEITDLNVTAAANVDGCVFAAAGTMLYEVPEDFLTGYRTVGSLPFALTDMAYNPADGYLYGISAENGIVRIDKLTGETDLVGKPAINTGTLACDDKGTFYSMCSDDDALYRFTLATLSAPEKLGSMSVTTVDDWTGEETTETPKVTNDTQSLLWNCNDGQLYWSWLYNPDGNWWVSATIYQISTDNWQCSYVTKFFDDPVVALYARDLDRTEEPAWAAPTETPVSVHLDHSSFDMKVGESFQLSAVALPWTLTDQSVVWSSSNDSVATVEENGTVTAKSAGSAVITAASKLDGSVKAECAVTVEGVELTIRGVMEGQDGQSALFAWDTSSNIRRDGGSVEVTPGSAAYVKETDELYVQDTGTENRMYEIDPATGETLNVSGAANTSIATWDLTAVSYIGKTGDAVGVYGPYIGIPGDLRSNQAMVNGFTFSEYLTYVTNATGFAGIASGGYQQITNQEQQEDGTTKEVVYDTEVFYLLDNKGYVWVVNMAQENGGYNCFLAGLLTTDLSGTLPFLGDGDLQRCSMVYDQDSGALVLSYFNGDGAEFYLLYAKEADSTNLTAVSLGDLGRDVYAAALYDVSVSNVESAQRICEMESAIELDEDTVLTQTAIPGGETAANTGSLNAAKTAQAADDGLVYVPVTLSQSRSGLLDVQYDADVLTLERVAAGADLISLRKAEGSVSLGFADLEGTDTPATLIFSRKDSGTATASVTFTVTQQEDKTGEPLSTRTETIRLKNYAVPTPGKPDDSGKNPFVDVAEKDFFYDAVLWAVENQVTNGTDATHFTPNGTCTRAQIVTFLWRAAGSPEPKSTENPFQDVSSESFAYKAILWAVENGITKGVDESHFRPNAGCTRAQVVTFLWRYAGSPAPKSAENPFQDVSSESFAHNAILWAVENGVTNGVDESHFRPGDTCTRAQIVTFLWRYLEK